MVTITGAKKILGFILGVLLVVLSIYLFMSAFGMKLPFAFLAALSNTAVLGWLLIVSSLFLVYDAITELGSKRIRSLVAAFIGIVFGLVPVLKSLKILAFTIVPEGTFGVVLYSISLIIIGGFLMWDITGG
jgi:small-conductance mechanosensitive channel